MKFFDWISCYDEYKLWLKTQNPQSIEPQVVDPKGKPLEPSDFVAMRLQQLRNYKKQGFPASHIAVQEDRLAAEEKWRKDGYPYYNVHPSLVKKFCSVNLTKVPAEFVEMPHGYESVAIKFAEQHSELTIPNVAVGIPKGSFIKSILMTRGFNTLRHYEESHEFKESLYCLLNFSSNSHTSDSHPNSLMVLPVWFREGENLDQALDNFILGIEKKKGADIAEVDRNCLKIIVTVGFLANSNDELIEYDVLSKFRNEFNRADETRRKSIIAKSKRRGKIGFNVGNDIMFLGERPFQSQMSNSEPTGRELEHAHIRSGHPHAVRYGEGKRKVKIMWFRPTTVRPDLPFKRED